MDRSWRRVLTNVVPGEGNGKLLHCSCLKNPMNSMKMQKDMAPEDKSPSLKGIQYATEKECRNSSRKNEKAGTKKKQCSVVDEAGGELKSDTVWNSIA